MKNVADFDKAIEKLDFLVIRGLEFSKDLKIGLRHFSDPNEKTKWFEPRKQSFLEWQLDVRGCILDFTDRRYYLVHFDNPSLPTAAIEEMSSDQSNLVMHVETKLKNLEEILVMLEERRNVVIRQEVAKSEHDKSHRYWLRYDDIAGKLYLNDTVLLASTRLDWPADKLLRQVFTSPNQLIELKGITSSQVTSALRDMNITGTLKKMFFPRTSGNKVMFRPFITNTEFVDEKHKEISLANLRKNEK